MRIYKRVELTCVRVQQRRSRDNLHCFCRLSRLQLEIHACGLVEHQRHRAVDSGLESRCCNSEIIGSDRHARQAEYTDIIGLYLVDGPSFCIFGGEDRADNPRPCRIHDAPRDRAGYFLAPRLIKNSEEYSQECKYECPPCEMELPYSRVCAAWHL